MDEAVESSDMVPVSLFEKFVYCDFNVLRVVDVDVDVVFVF